MVYINVFVTGFLLPALTIEFGSCSPLIPTPTLEKRAAGTPKIGPGFTAQQREQLMDAFKDANELADFAINTRTMSVFNLYFAATDVDEVEGVFKRVYKNNKPNPTLSDITFSTDYPDPESGKYACPEEPYPVATMREYDSDDPIVIICPDRAFPHGGIAKGYSGVTAITCGYIGDNVSWRMDVLGATVLHEYLHWIELVTVGPTAEAIVDEDMGYGAYNTQILPASKAITNADSYTWFALQNFWTATCDKTYKAPTKLSSEDPYCGHRACKPTRGDE